MDLQFTWTSEACTLGDGSAGYMTVTGNGSSKSCKAPTEELKLTCVADLSAYPLNFVND